MTLETKTFKNYTGKIIWGIIIACLSIFILRVALWENTYYSTKEGSTRAVATSEHEEEEIIEVEPTKEEEAEHVVPENSPRYITIDSLGVIGRMVIPVGLTATGELDTPRNIYQIGWYEKSGAPGYGGTLVLDGHNGGPNVEGVLKHLPEVEIGAKILIERGDGNSYSYTVVENTTVPLSESDAYMKTAFTSPVSGKESLTIITCTGEWSDLQSTYLSRQFLRAVRD